MREITYSSFSASIMGENIWVIAWFGTPGGPHITKIRLNFPSNFLFPNGIIGGSKVMMVVTVMTPRPLLFWGDLVFENTEYCSGDLSFNLDNTL